MWPLIGHTATVTALERALAAGRLAQAYLVVGPESVGKARLALGLAQALNCQQPQPGPCGECPQCRRIASGMHPDVTVTALEGGRRVVTIEQVRELQHSLSLRPFEGRCRVAILPDAGRLTAEASNALLKTLEEPAPDTVLILCATSEAEMLPTICSRCRAIALQPVPTGELTAALEQRPGVTQQQALEAAAFARGRPGLALRALADPALLETVGTRLHQLRTALALDIAGRLLLAGALAGGSASAEGRTTLLETLEVWQHWWRDALLVKAGCDGPLVYPAEAAALHQATAQLSLAELRQAVTATQQAMRRVAQNANPRLVIDVLLLGLPAVPGLVTV